MRRFLKPVAASITVMLVCAACQSVPDKKKQPDASDGRKPTTEIRSDDTSSTTPTVPEGHAATPPASPPGGPVVRGDGVRPPPVAPDQGVAIPPAPPPARPPTAQERAQAHEQTRAGLAALEHGDAETARTALGKALSLDPQNELARNLSDQIDADPVTELGAAFFEHRVQPGESVSSIAQRCLGDKYKFYLLARYNDIHDPSRLSVGQRIKVPGQSRACLRSPQGTRPPPEPPKPPTQPPPSGRGDAERAYAQGLDQQRAGNQEAAYRAFAEAARLDPSYSDAFAKRDALRVELVRRYDREAKSAFNRQQLDSAISLWGKVLDLDPGNEPARLNQARAIELRERLEELKQ